MFKKRPPHEVAKICKKRQMSLKEYGSEESFIENDETEEEPTSDDEEETVFEKNFS